MKSEMDLERMLGELGAMIEVPAEPDIAPAVRTRIESASAPGRGFALHPWLWTRRSIALAAALFVLASGIAVGSYFGVRGVRIHVEPTPTPTFAIGGELALGAPTSMDEVARLVRFPVRIPAALGPPDEVYITQQILGGGVWMLYKPRPDLPESKSSKAGLVLLQFEGSFSRESMFKEVGPDQISDVTVGGEHGFWIDGVHGVAYTQTDGAIAQDDLRIADNTLLWQVGSVTLRLESALSRDAAIRIAESVR